jgi:CubicO group peptidase (beta-lactamase class C family)
VQIDFTGGTSRRAFGHGGMASSRGLADPECGLVLVAITNGLAGVIENEQRFMSFTDAVYTALGDEIAPLRRSVKSRETASFST